MTKKLNSTGSLWLNNDGNAFSYNTQLTNTYKGLRVFNNTFYSMTTRKHQAYFNRNNFDLILTTCRYETRLTSGEIEQAINEELNYINDCLFELSNKKRKTSKTELKHTELLNRKEFLVNVLNK